MLKIGSIIICTFLFTGCIFDKPCQCSYPTFPKPSQETANKIMKLNDAEVDKWMRDLRDLSKMLEIK